MSKLTLPLAVEMLTDNSSSKRRTAAKYLRRSKDNAAGRALLNALNREVTDSRTWETQYHMVMALGTCHYTPALPRLLELSGETFDATMVYVALGDTIVRLRVRSPHDAQPILLLMASEKESLVDGAFRAMALLRMCPDEETIGKILDYVSEFPADSGLDFWVAAAAAGWAGAAVDKFLDRCIAGPRDDIRQAALASRGRVPSLVTLVIAVLPKYKGSCLLLRLRLQLRLSLEGCDDRPERFALGRLRRGLRRAGAGQGIRQHRSLHAGRWHVQQR